MNDPEYYFEIASHAYLIGTILVEAYCLSIWGGAFMSVKAKVWYVSAAYVIAMIVLEYISVAMSGMVAHLIGIMIAFVVMCLTDRGYAKQKFYLIIAFYSLRWLSWNIIGCVANEMMLVWSALYLRTTEQGIQLWIFDNYWIGQYVLQSIAELMIGFLLIYGAVRWMLRVYGNRREHMNNKEFVLPITSKADGSHGFGLANIRRVAQKYFGDMEIGKETYAGRECCVLRVMLQIAGDSGADKEKTDRQKPNKY